MSTMVFDLNGVGKALDVATEFIGGGQWKTVPGSVLQHKLVHRLADVTAGLDKIPEMSGFAAPTADPLNEALANAGFDIRLDPWEDDGLSFGAVALLKMGVRWLERGETHEKGGDQTPFTVRGDKPAFRLKTHPHGVEFGEVTGSDEPVVIVPTQSEDTVYFFRTDAKPADAFDMYDLAEKITRAERSWKFDYAGVYVPMIDADREVDLSWMLGMSCLDYLLLQALQQVIFKMNDLGASAESGTAVAMARGAPAGYYTIDGPFIAVISRPEVRMPNFVGYLDLDVFSDPGELAA